MSGTARGGWHGRARLASVLGARASGRAVSSRVRISRVMVPFASRGGGGPPRGVVRLGTSDSTDAVLQSTPSLEVIRRRGEAQAQEGDRRRDSNIAHGDGSVANLKKRLDSRFADSRARKERDAMHFVASASKLDPKDVHVKAKSLANYGNLPAACELLSRALERHPDNMYLLTTLGRMETKRGNAVAARAAFTRAVKRCGGDSSAITLQAWAILEAQLGPRTRARELFQRAINLDASHTASWHAWAMMEAAAGHVGKARQYFRRASETNPRHLPTLQAWARLEAQQGELAAARVKFQQALTVDSTHIPSWQAWAEMEMREGSDAGVAKARRLFKRGRRQAESVNTGWARGQLGALLTSWGSLEAERGHEAKALGLLKAATGANPYNAQAWLMWAHVTSNRQVKWEGERRVPDPVQLARTAAIVDEGLAHCSDNTQLLHLRAMVQLSQGDAPAAEAAMHQLVKADPRNGRAWHSLGLMMQRAGDFEAAEQYFREGVRQARAGPHRAKCYDKLAMEMSVRGSVDEARQLFADGCAAAPGSAYHLRQWALFEKKNGTAEDARRLFEQAAAAQPSASRTWLQWGLFERSQRNVAGARRCFRSGLLANPNDAFVWQSLAALEVREGDTDAARAAFSLATERCKKEAVLWMEWALFEMRLGDLTRARELFTEGAALTPLHVQLVEAWALMEMRDGQAETARELLARLEAAGVDPEARVVAMAEDRTDLVVGREWIISGQRQEEDRAKEEEVEVEEEEEEEEECDGGDYTAPRGVPSLR